MVSLRDADRSAIYDAAHHDGVNSERVGPTKPKPESLPDEIREKIGRYVAAWHRKYDGAWPAVPQGGDVKLSAWFAIEKFFDNVLYRMYRAIDWMIVFIYCFAPLALLRKYRAARGRGETMQVRQERLVSAPVKE